MRTRLLLRRVASCAVFCLPLALVTPALCSQDAKVAVEEPEYVGQLAGIGPSGKILSLELTNASV